MEVDTARRLLADGAATKEPVFLPPSVLSKLSIDDLLPAQARADSAWEIAQGS
jgi:hypothetical protein